MNHNPIGMPELFAQLGLDDSYPAIASFIQDHPLAPDTCLADAKFWNPSQRAFLRESWSEDSDWCELVDQLDEMLHKAPATH